MTFCLIARWSAALVVASASSVAAQVIVAAPRLAATGVQQQAIELAAALGVAPGLAKDFAGRLPNAALDARLHGNFMDSEWGTRIFRENPDMRQDSSMTTPSHTDKHLAELAGVLGIKTIVADKTASCNDPPSPCRIGKNSALIVFSPASLQGDTAFVAVKVGWTSEPQSNRSFHVSVYRVTLLLANGVWKVQKISIVAVN